MELWTTDIHCKAPIWHGKKPPAMTSTPPISPPHPHPTPTQPTEKGSRHWTLLKTQEADGKMRRGRERGGRLMTGQSGRRCTQTGAVTWHSSSSTESTVPLKRGSTTLAVTLIGQDKRGLPFSVFFFFFSWNDWAVQWDGVGLWMWPMAVTHINSKQSNVGLKHTSAGTSGSGGGASWLEIRGWC